jgi:ribulose kinase
MSEAITFTPVPVLDDAFLDAYAQRVDQLIADRKQQGALLSTFDLIAGAALIYFAAEKQMKLPAKWIFGAFREGMLPDGIMDEAGRVAHRIRETDDTIDMMQTLVDEADDLSREVIALREETKKLRNKVNATVRKLNDNIESIDKKLFTPALVAPQEPSPLDNF